VGIRRLVPLTAAPQLSRVRNLKKITVADIREIAAGRVIDQFARRK